MKMLKKLKVLLKRKESPTIRDALIYEYQSKCDCCTCNIEKKTLTLDTELNKAKVIIELDNIHKKFLNFKTSTRYSNFLHKEIKIRYKKKGYYGNYSLEQFLKDIKNNVLIEKINHIKFLNNKNQWVKLQHDTTLTIKGIDNPNYKFVKGDICNKKTDK